MDIIIKKSVEITESEWHSYTESFNNVFNKTEQIKDFKKKYLLTIDNQSYHAFLKENDHIIGACTVIPYFYNFFGSKLKTGLAVDVFILEQFRNDPFALFRMYKALKKLLKEQNISLVIAVPNDIAYPYWKNIVKWKDIGLLQYHALPVNAGKFIKKLPWILNPLSQFLSKFIIWISFLFNAKEKSFPINIDKQNSIIDKQRYTDCHHLIEQDDSFFSYRIMEEDGIQTCYLIDFYNKEYRIKDTLSLRNAISYILHNEKVDIIIFVGKISFFQLLLFKVPYRYEPKHLYFTVDFLESFDNDFKSSVLNIKNWDFGLFNYDVR